MGIHVYTFNISTQYNNNDTLHVYNYIETCTIAPFVHYELITEVQTTKNYSLVLFLFRKIDSIV